MNFAQIQNNLNEINDMLDQREKEVTYSQSQPSVYYSQPQVTNIQCRDKNFSRPKFSLPVLSVAGMLGAYLSQKSLSTFHHPVNSIKMRQMTLFDHSISTKHLFLIKLHRKYFEKFKMSNL